MEFYEHYDQHLREEKQKKLVDEGSDKKTYFEQWVKAGHFSITTAKLGTM